MGRPKTVDPIRIRQRFLVFQGASRIKSIRRPFFVTIDVSCIRYQKPVPKPEFFTEGALKNLTGNKIKSSVYKIFFWGGTRALGDGPPDYGIAKDYLQPHHNM